MINQKPSVYSKLKELKESDVVSQVCEEGSQDWANMPCITYMELENEPSSMVEEDEEYSSALAIKVDVWVKASSNITTTNIAIQVVNKMSELGYKRTLFLDVPDSESKIKHKTMQFEKIEFLN